MKYEDIQPIIDRLDNDVIYFENIGFPILANKFREDLNAIKHLKTAVEIALEDLKNTQEKKDSN